jgi:hypothetical protein
MPQTSRAFGCVKARAEHGQDLRKRLRDLGERQAAKPGLIRSPESFAPLPHPPRRRSYQG